MGFFSSLSFLTPLYIAAGLAVSLPILFHLIRRTPRGRQVFSSLMFLSPSPPRVTRRSRIEHWLLLLLRAAAVLLIVAAFCRPLWREPLSASETVIERDTIVLLDCSASMRRKGLWSEALDRVRAQLESARTGDFVNVLLFDETVRPVLADTDLRNAEPAQRTSLILQQLTDVSPGWRGTHLGGALQIAADRLEQDATNRSGVVRRSIVVISDLQEGSRWESLQGVEWPAGVEVRFQRVGVTSVPSNAGVQLVGSPGIGERPFVRVRVTNSANSEKETFHLGWRGPFDDPSTADSPASNAIEVYVPPGQSRVVKLEQPAGEFQPSEVVLTGDDHDFDNRVYVAWPQRQEDVVVYLGPDTPADRNGMRFFLDPLFAESPSRRVTIVESFTPPAKEGEAPANTAEQPTLPALAIVTGVPEADEREALAGYLNGGGVVLCVVRDAATGELVYQLSGNPPAAVTDADVSDYAMLRDVDFTHPLFRSLDDPRFSDLTKVHFWRHRSLPRDSLPGLRTLASFDNGNVAMGELNVGQGKLLILTSGWNRDDSQLATWAKFVPIMNALLAYGHRANVAVDQLAVGSPLPIAVSGRTERKARTITRPGGQPQRVGARPPVAETPGMYVIHFDDEAPEDPGTRVAVNLAADESRTAPLEVDILSSLGVRVAGTEAAAVPAEKREQLARRDLESRQKLWRWLLVAGLVVLLTETLYAARQSQRLADIPVE